LRTNAAASIGRWFEIGEDGSECNWGKVLAWEPPTRVLLAWQINGDWKYDASLVTEVEVTFTPLSAGETRVAFEDAVYAHADSDVARE
jgi:hypothetical protein